MSFSTDERAALTDLLHRLGPDAPTLCEGWNTRDLVSHLWLRENTVVPNAGMFVAALSPQLNTAMDRVRQRDYHQLVTSWSHGAAGLNPRRPPWTRSSISPNTSSTTRMFAEPMDKHTPGRFRSPWRRKW